tara:strand:- start:43 stop:471 length:429 start_codon:yes stop_codon:yes gene_type:complete
MKKLLLLLFVIVYPLHSSEVLYCSEKESTGFGTKNNEPYTTSSFELTRFIMELSVGEFDSKLTIKIPNIDEKLDYFCSEEGKQSSRDNEEKLNCTEDSDTGPYKFLYSVKNKKFLWFRGSLYSYPLNMSDTISISIGTCESF